MKDHESPIGVGSPTPHPPTHNLRLPVKDALPFATPTLFVRFNDVEIFPTAGSLPQTSNSFHASLNV